MTYVSQQQRERQTKRGFRLGTDRWVGSTAGITLIELLIVIVILTTLVAAAIPILSPSSNDRRIREASRAINTYITAAQTKAMELRRPVGVALKKLSADTGSANDNGVCLELYQVEQPPTFTGFDETSAVRISLDQATPNQVRIQFVRRGNMYNRDQDQLPDGWDRDEIPPGVFRRGDRIKVAGNLYRFSDTTPDLNASGFYQTNSGEPDGVLFAQVENDSGQMLSFVFDHTGFRVKPVANQAGRVAMLRENFPVGALPTVGVPPFWSEPAVYKILRQPSPTSAEPYQLPEGIAIDLRASGDSRDVYHNAEHQQPIDRNNNQTPIMIMFTPEGTVHRVVLNVGPGLSGYDNIISDPVVSSIFLLIGPRENIPVAHWTSDNTLKQVGINQLTNTELEELKTSINWLNTESRWVAIGAQSGRVVSTENAFVDPSAVLAVATTGNPPIPESSLGLRSLQIHAAREFAREMTQSGDL